MVWHLGTENRITCMESDLEICRDEVGVTRLTIESGCIGSICSIWILVTFGYLFGAFP